MRKTGGWYRRLWGDDPPAPIGLAVDGAVALIAASRRQRAAGFAQDLARQQHELAGRAEERAAGNGQQERELASTRLLHERFATAAGQLGDDKPVVRVAGVYALAALADDWPQQRQTCVDVLCAYLRMPYAPDPGDKTPLAWRHTFQALREVRCTVIRVITAHLQPDSRRTATAQDWRGLNLDFTGATFDGGSFRGAEFSGDTVSFAGARFSGEVSFINSEFSGGWADFGGAEFSGGRADFTNSEFSGGTIDFANAKFTGGTVDFTNAEFSGSTVDFANAKFSSGAISFASAEFSGGWVGFTIAEFTGTRVDFTNTEFTGSLVGFTIAAFAGSTVDFGGAAFASGIVDFANAKFSGGMVGFTGAEFSGAKVGFHDAEFSGAKVDLTGAEFDGGEVDLGNAAVWQVPPHLPDWEAEPDGVTLPAHPR